MIRLLGVLLLYGLSAQAQTITEIFGSGANQFSIDFVEIGNPGNAPEGVNDNAGYSLRGSVSYIYNIGKYEISREMILKANVAGGLGISMTDMTSYGGNGLSQPAAGIGWTEAARFVNFLNTSRGKQAAYKFDANGNFQVWDSGQYRGNNQFRHIDAYYFLPSVDEWYKGAYGDLSGNWYDYPTGSDNAPTPVSSGTNNQTVVFGQTATTGPAEITKAGGLSPFGTMAQGGNIWEWCESAFDGVNDSATENRELRGSAWILNSSSPWGLASDRRTQGEPIPEEVDYYLGFRVAMVPEPSSLSLLLAGGAVIAAAKRRRSV